MQFFLQGFEHLQGVNLSLQKLTLLGETESISYLKIILSIFPNIVELSFNNNHLLNQELMEYINANHQRVTKIRFNSCSRDIFQFLRLQNLKFLEISENQKMDSWLQFIQNHPDLEAMVLKDELLTNEHFQLFTSKMENLRTLELHHDELLTRDILDIAFSKDCKLKILRLKDIFGRQGIGFTVEDQQKLKETDNNLLLFVKQKN